MTDKKEAAKTASGEPDPQGRDRLVHLRGVACGSDPLFAAIGPADLFAMFGLGYTSLPNDRTAPEGFGIPAHRALYAYWTARRRGDALPSSEGIDPADFREALGYVLLVEPDAEADDFYYRIYGSKVAEVFGKDMSGHWASDFSLPAAALFQAQYQAVQQFGLACYSEHDAPPEVSSVVRWCRLILPLADDDSRVDRILIGNVPMRRTHAS